MKVKHTGLLNWLIFALLIIVNSWIYIHRDDGYAYTSYANQNQLYTISENPHLTNFILHGTDSLEVMIEPFSAQNNWVVNKQFSKNKFNHPIIKLIEGRHQYTLFNNADSITLGFDYVKSQTYKESGRTRESVIELCYSSAPSTNGNLYSMEHWQQSSPFTTEQEIIAVQQFLKDSLQITSTDKDISIIEKISSHILKNIGSCKGIPTDAMNTLSPVKQFNLAKAKQSKVWCGDFADIFSFYAKCSGIHTRLVCLEGKIGDVSKAGHSFNEAYIKELKKWVFVDLTSNSIFVKSSSNQYLNSIEFYNLYHLSPKEISITSMINDSVMQENFDSVKAFYDDYFQSNNQFVFYNHKQFENTTYDFTSKIKRYISKNSTFSIYTEAKDNNNEKFYYKQFALLALLSFTLYRLINFLILKLKP